MREVNKDLNIIFLVFCCSSRTWLVGVLSSHLHGGCGTRVNLELTQNSRNSPRMSAVIFSLSSHHHVSCPNNFSFCFQFHAHFNGLHSSFFQPITACGRFGADTFLFFSDVCCYPDQDLRKPLFTFPFFSPFYSVSVCLSVCLSLSLSLYIYIYLWLPWISFSYMSRSFHRPVVDLLI